MTFWRTQVRRFVLLFEGRTGSTYLMEGLAQHPHIEARGGALVLLQDAADLPVHLTRIDALGGVIDTTRQARKRRFDAARELLVHRLFFAPALR